MSDRTRTPGAVHHPSATTAALPRREREVLDLLYGLGEASVAQVQEGLADHPTYSATRMLLQRLHRKGLLSIRREGARYIYRPTTEKSAAGKTALRSLLDTFFDGSPGAAVAALLGDVSEQDNLTQAELRQLQLLVDKAGGDGGQQADGGKSEKDVEQSGGDSLRSSSEKVGVARSRDATDDNS